MRFNVTGGESLAGSMWLYRRITRNINVVGFVAEWKSFRSYRISPKVVVNERTGTIGDVSVDSVAITQGGLSAVTRKKAAQPPPFSYGTTVVTKSDNVEVTGSGAQYRPSGDGGRQRYCRR